MKNRVLIFVSLSFVFTLLVLSIISLIAGGWVFTSIRSVLYKSSPELCEMLSDTSLYKEEVDLSFLKNNPILTVGFGNNCSIGAKSFEERVETEKEFNYYVFDGNKIHLMCERVDNEGKTHFTYSREEKIFPYKSVFENVKMKTSTFGGHSVKWRWISDIYYGGAVQFICGKLCKIENVVVFDGEAHGGDTSVYLITNKGIFVRHYVRWTGEVYEMTEDQFRQYCRDEGKRASKEDELTSGSTAIPIDSTRNGLWGYSVVYRVLLPALVISAAITVYAVLEKRKKSTALQEEEPPTEE